MKIRSGFVSNSSSSSFIVKKDDLSSVQLYAIRNHREFSNLVYKTLEELLDRLKRDCELNMCDLSDVWAIAETEKEICCSTNMDNFDLYHFLRLIGVDDSDISEKKRWG